MKRYIAFLCIFCLLLSGCAAKESTPSEEESFEVIPLSDIEQRLEKIYPNATIERVEADYGEMVMEVTCATDLENYDKEQSGGIAEGHKYISSLEQLRKNDERHYCIVRGYRVGPPMQHVRFRLNGDISLRETYFTVKVTQICHQTDEEIGEEITVSGTGVILLPHGEQRVLHRSLPVLPEENTEYFFVLDQVSGGWFHYYNPLASDLRIDENLKSAEKLTQAQKLTRDLMEEYL